MTTNENARLGRVLPELTAEIVRLLRAKGERSLARKFAVQPFHQWCPCGDDFCQSFYTQPRPGGPYGPGHRTVCLQPATGMINIDVVGEDIRYVEVLSRPAVRRQLRVVPDDLPVSSGAVGGHWSQAFSALISKLSGRLDATPPGTVPGRQ